MKATDRVGVVLPVHDEEELLGACLRALETACRETAVACEVAIVLDRCRDSSAAIARRWRRHLRLTGPDVRAVVLSAPQPGVGEARRWGAEVLLGRSRVPARRTWLATTDADSKVPPDWLVAQLAKHESGAQLWTGRVSVEDWRERQPGTGKRWAMQYEREAIPVHGANLGVNGDAYVRAGGFRPIASGEDRALHAAVLSLGVRAAYDRQVVVVTSARRAARAPEGFAAALTRIERAQPGLPAIVR